jgi:hypothetical protein
MKRNTRFAACLASGRSITGMRQVPRALALGVLLAAMAPSACGGNSTLPLTGVDISPDQVNGVPADTGASTAGLIHTLAGDENTLYAVSLNAGVWRSAGGGPWAQLPNSPPRAYSIAVDPSNPHHIAVGERDGDSIDVSRNNSGIRESYDSGDTFGDYFDPRTHSGCNGSQAIPTLTFTHQGSVLVAATACGVAVKPAKGQPWSFPTTPIGAALVTAVVASETKVWARDAQGTLIVSTDSGQTWNLATQNPLPAGTTFLSGGDQFSLAAFDDYAYMSIQGEDNGLGNNFNALLIYDVKHDRWVIQKRIFDPADNVQNDPNFGTLNGTGAGQNDGRRFVRAFKVNAVEGPPVPVVVFGAGQDVLMSTGQDTQTGLLTWQRVAGTRYNCDPMTGICYPPKGPSFQRLVHEDIWDLLVSRNDNLWLAGDGGVFENDQDGRGWLKRNQGLHTHHVHMLYAAPLGAAYAYPTTDNAAWFKGFTGDWQHDSVGDSNWVVGDINTHPLFAYAARNPSSSTLTGFDDNVPDADLQNVGTTVSNVQRAADQGFDGPLTFNAIQTVPGEPKPPSQFDAVMLAKMPLQYVDPQGNLVTVIADPGQPLALVRNPVWVNHPDINEAKGQGWQLMADNLPAGTVGFLVANGHQHPALFVLAGPNTNALDLYRWDGKLHGTWARLPINGVGQPSQLLWGGPKGPVFVNPYNANQIYALTATGVRYTTSGGNKSGDWRTDTALTNAITGNGQYPLTGTFGGGNGTNVQVGSHAVLLGTLSDMAFELGLPDHVAAASPFTGVFYNKGDGQWIDLRAGLPQVFTPVSSVAIFGNVVVVGMEGRGLWQIRNIGQ